MPPCCAVYLSYCRLNGLLNRSPAGRDLSASSAAVGRVPPVTRPSSLCVVVVVVSGAGADVLGPRLVGAGLDVVVPRRGPRPPPPPPAGVRAAPERTAPAKAAMLPAPEASVSAACELTKPVN